MKDSYNLQSECVKVELIKKGKIVATIDVNENNYDFNSLNLLLNDKIYHYTNEDRKNVR